MSMARRWQSWMSALVSWSASAQAVDTDLDGENVRSNPATGPRDFAPCARSSASIPALCSARSASLAVGAMACTRSATRVAKES